MDRIIFKVETGLELSQYIDFDDEKVDLDVVQEMLNVFSKEVIHYYFLKEHG